MIHKERKEGGKEEDWNPRLEPSKAYSHAVVTAVVLFDLHPVGKVGKVVDSFLSIEQ